MERAEPRAVPGAAFDGRGRSVAPALYARLYRAAYGGLKGGNSTAKVAIGETAAHGRDRRTSRRGLQQTHSPGRFAQLVAKQRPRVRFDAWAHHPYPTSSRVRPTQRFRWPNVGLTGIGSFGAAIDAWYGRKGTKIWITEYAHETGHRGVALSTQAAYAGQALSLARRNARVQMFVWFVLQDRLDALAQRAAHGDGRGEAVLRSFRSGRTGRRRTYARRHQRRP